MWLSISFWGCSSSLNVCACVSTWVLCCVCVKSGNRGKRSPQCYLHIASYSSNSIKSPYVTYLASLHELRHLLSFSLSLFLCPREISRKRSTTGRKKGKISRSLSDFRSSFVDLIFSFLFTVIALFRNIIHLFYP